MGLKNTMNDKVSHFFVDRYIDTIDLKDDVIRKEFFDDLSRLNRVLNRENLRISNGGNTLIVNQKSSDDKKKKTSENQNDEGNDKILDIKISNFCVIPTHKLYVKKENFIYEDGIGVKVITKIGKKKYKCIYINLNNEMIEKGYWISPFYLDHDLYLYDKKFYNHIRIAIKLSTRMLAPDEFKIFDGEWWLENRFADVEISEFNGFPKTNFIQILAHPLRTCGEIKPLHINVTNDMIEEKGSKIDQDIIHFLLAINELVNKELILKKGDSPDADIKNIGWKDDEKYYLLYLKAWEWVYDFLNMSDLKFSSTKKEIEFKLYEMGMIDLEVEKNGRRKRADCNTTVYTGKKERVLRVSIAGLYEFITKNNV